MDASHLRTNIEANTLGKYHLMVALGRGGMATAYLAVMQGPVGFNKLVVIKEMHPQHAQDPDVVGMFLDEARLAAKLLHPNVVQTNEVGEEGGRHFIAMEYLDGHPLSRVIHRLGAALPLSMHLQILVDLLSGLHY